MGGPGTSFRDFSLTPRPGVASLGMALLLRRVEGVAGAEPEPAVSVPEPPGPIDNSRIAQVKGSGHVQLKQGEFPRRQPGSSLRFLAARLLPSPVLPGAPFPPVLESG